MKIVPKLLAPWRSCTKCSLSKSRRSLVLGRGSIPADILFVGIGPGVAEDVLGQAFIGPSGKILNRAIEDASRKAGWTPRCYFSHLVACRPCNDRRADNRDPSDDEILACRARLSATARVVKAQRVVLLGQTVQAEGRKVFPDGEKLPHPISVLLNGGTVENAIGTVAYQRFWMALWGIIERTKKEVGE